MEEQPTRLPSVRADSPDIKDKLGFAPYAKTISQIILDDNVETPLTIGIFGSWGSGKTTLMRMVEFQIQEAALQNPQRLTLPIWFNAWLYSKEEVLWRALLAQVITAVGRMDVPAEPKKRQKKNEQLEALKTRLYRTLGARELGSLSFDMADLLQSSGSGAQLTLTLQQGFDLFEKVGSAASESKKGKNDGEPPASEAEQDQLAKMLVFRKQVQQAATDLEQGRLESLDKFRAEFDELMREYVSDEGYLVVFVDDLDRCLPEKAVEVLEAIKLFLDVEGCIFILAIDQGVVERGIQLRYRELGEATEENGEKVIDGSRYLEKIVQIPFVLPPISPRTMGQYVASLAPDLPDPECGNVFAQGLEANPRHVKRAINIFSLLWRLAQNKSELTALVDPVRLAKLVVLQQRHENLYELLRKNPARLRDWEAAMRNITEGQSLRSQLDDELREVDEEDLQSLRGLLTMHDQTRAEMNFADLKPEELHAYVYLASAVEETTIPVQQVVQQTAVPPITPKDLAEATSEEPLEAVEGDVVMEDPRRQFVSVHSGLEEARLSFATATVFHDLDKQLAQFDTDPPDPTRGVKMAELLGTAGWQLYDQIVAPDARTVLEGQLAEPTQLRIAPGRGQERIPWEILYDGPPPSGSQPLRKMKQPLETAALDPERFWGFKHIIERPGSGYGRQENMLSGQGKPLLLAHIGSDTPGAASIEQSLKSYFASGFQTLHSPDDFFRSLSMASDPSRIYILRARAGIEQGETWIGFGFEETNNRADLSNLYSLLNRYFDMSELQTLVFDLGIQFEDISGESKMDKTRELVLYLQRRDRIPELVQKFKELRPKVDIESVFSPNLVRLTRKQLESWTAQGSINALLILDVDKGLVQAEDWSAWLSLFFRMGFAGVVAPTIAPNLERSWPFIEQLFMQFSNGIPLGEVLRRARRDLWEKEKDPIGLFYAYFGPASLRFSSSAGETA